jgi:hypothetical protein
MLSAMSLQKVVLKLALTLIKALVWRGICGRTRIKHAKALFWRGFVIIRNLVPRQI